MGLSLEKISVLDPLPGNPNHCKISSFTKHQDYCARHRLEVDELPLARLQRWPEDPDFAQLYDRVFNLRSQFRSLFDISTLDQNDFFVAAKKRYDGIGRSHVDGLGTQFSKYSGHGAG
jgi:hypothetical protein